MTSSTKECPICMDDICLNVNCVTTECGHQFHTSCLMQNVAHNGFGCPYCRNKLADDLEEEESEYDSDYDEDDDEEDEAYDEEEDEEVPVGYNEMALHGMRQLFRRANNDIEEAGEREARVVTAEEMTCTLIDAGYNITDIVKAFMINTGFHLHYPDDTTEEDEFVEKIETHMEKVLNYEIPIVFRQLFVSISSNQIEEEQDVDNNIDRMTRLGNNVNITSSYNKMVDDCAESKTTNKNKTINFYDDECL